MEEMISKICEDLCCREILPDEELIATGVLDSFRIMELICDLEEKFQIVFLPEEISDLDNLSNVNNIVDFVKRKQSR